MLYIYSKYIMCIIIYNPSIRCFFTQFSKTKIYPISMFELASIYRGQIKEYRVFAPLEMKYVVCLEPAVFTHTTQS